MKKKGMLKALVGVICVAMFAGVFAEKSFAWWPWGKKEAPKVLRMGLIPAEDMTKMVTGFEPARQYLEKELGMKIEVFKALDYTAVIEAMRAQKVEIAYFGPFSYVLAAKRANARAIVAGGDANGNLAVFRSVLITHRDSGLKSIDDVKARASNLTLSFVDPASTSGHLIPRGAMEYLGIKVDKAFKEVVFAGGHDASMLAVHARKVDFGATGDGRFKRAIESKLISPEDVFVIWTSDPIPSSPIAVRGDLDEALIQRIQRAFIDMPQKAPQAFKQMQGVLLGKESHVAVTDADYEFIRQVAIGLDKL